jgi:hypothetical protein
MSTLTTNYSLQKPAVGGETDAWGGELNANMDTIDTTMKAISVVANAALPASTYVASDILTKIKTVDGAGSGLDADTLDGQDSTFYRSASNITVGTLPVAQLPVKALRHAGAYGSANVTVSTAAPSGGASGDIWLQI